MDQNKKGVFHQKYENILDTPATNVAMTVFTAVVCVFCAVPDILLLVPQRLAGRIRKTPRKNERWVIIMGGGFITLRRRCLRTIELYRGNERVRFFLSGTDREGHIETAFMKDMLTEAGFPSNRITLDPKGFSTFETFVNAKNSGIKRAAVVTSDFHQFRCVNTGRLMGLDIVSTSMRFRPYFTRWRYWFRERLAVYADMIKVLRYRMKYRSPRRDGLK